LLHSIAHFYSTACNLHITTDSEQCWHVLGSFMISLWQTRKVQIKTWRIFSFTYILICVFLNMSQ